METKCKLDKSSCIYAIIGGDKFYIGSTKELKERFKRHKSDLKNGVHSNNRLQNYAGKYGVSNLSFVVLEFCSQDLLIEREQWWIDSTRSHERNVGFNLNKNASKPPMSDEIRRMISERQKGKVARNKGVKMGEEQRLAMVGKTPSASARKKMSEAKKANPTRYWLGKSHSEETKRKIGIVQKGRVVSEETKLKKSRKGVWYTPSGDEIVILNISQFCRETALDKARMCDVYSGRRKSHKGYKLKHKLIQ